MGRGEVVVAGKELFCARIENKGEAEVCGSDQVRKTGEDQGARENDKEGGREGGRGEHHQRAAAALPPSFRNKAQRREEKRT